MPSGREVAGVMVLLPDGFPGRLPCRETDVTLSRYPDGKLPSRVVCAVEQPLLNVALDGESVDTEESDGVLVEDDLRRVVQRLPVPVEEPERLVGEVGADRLVGLEEKGEELPCLPFHAISLSRLAAGSTRLDVNRR